MTMHRYLSRTTLLAGVAAAALVVGAPQAVTPAGSPVNFVATAEAQAAISISFFYDRLADQGRWMRHHAHGWVWVPVGVGPGWRPYVEGRWVHTERYGWYWVSYEPFGWATYRYGRWGYHPAYGWYWVPGTVWAPAWVTWRVGGGYVGWAPLAPERRGYVWDYPRRHRPAVAESWVFVEAGFVHDPNLHQHVVPVAEIPQVIVMADQRINIEIEQNIIINRPIAQAQFAEFGVELPTVDLTFVDDPAAVEADADVALEQIAAFQAEIEPVEPAETPPQAAEAPEELEDPPLLTEVLDEVPEEADAPSVAQIDEEQIEMELEEELPPEQIPDGPAVTGEIPDETPEEPVEELPAEPEVPDEPPVTDTVPEPEAPEELPEAAPEEPEVPDEPPVTDTVPEPEAPEAPPEAAPAEPEVPDEPPVTDTVPEPEAPEAPPAELPAQPEPEEELEQQ